MSYDFINTPAFSIIIVFLGLVFVVILAQFWILLTRKCCYKDDLENQLLNLELNENIDQETLYIMAAAFREREEERNKKNEIEAKKIKPLFTFSPCPEIEFIVGEKLTAYILTQTNLNKTVIFPTAVVVNFFYCAHSADNELDNYAEKFDKATDKEVPERVQLECANGHAFAIYGRWGVGKTDDGPTEVKYTNLIFGQSVPSKTYGQVVSREISMLFRRQQFKAMCQQIPTVLAEFKKRSSIHKLMKNHQAHKCGVCSVSDAQLGKLVTQLVGWLVGWLVGRSTGWSLNLLVGWLVGHSTV